MAEIDHSPTLRRRRLSAELRRLRDAAGLTAEEVSRRLEWSRGKLTHIERAQWRRPSPRDVRDLMDVYGVVDESRREAMIVLAREARQRGWWAPYQDLLKGPYVDLESEAATIRAYHPLNVPGLLQTRAYATALARAALIPAQGGAGPGSRTAAGAPAGIEAEIERRVEVRMRRQRILTRERPPELALIIDEAALLRGSDVMPDQLRHLAEMAAHDTVTVQVMPNAAGFHAGLAGSFVLLGFAHRDDPGIVYLETAADDLYLENPDEIARYTLIHDRLRAQALDPEASIAHLKRLIELIERSERP